jgi:mediator of RNA polymerase II transcription subunit 14
MVNLHVNVRELALKSIHHKILDSRSSSLGAFSYPSIGLSLGSIYKIPTRHGSWMKEHMKVTFLDINPDGSVTNIALGEVLKSRIPLIKQVRGLDDDVSFSPKGPFAIRTRTKLGRELVSELTDKLNRIERLVKFLEIIGKHSGMKASEISLGRILLTYPSPPAHGEKFGKKLTADLNFSTTPMTIGLAAGNPHLRIHAILSSLLNSAPTLEAIIAANPTTNKGEDDAELANHGLTQVISALQSTSRLLPAIDELEARDPYGGTFVVARDSDWYQIKYPSHRVIEVRLRVVRSTPVWFIRDLRISISGQRAEGGDEMKVTERLKELFQENGEGWVGLKTGIECSDTSVGTVLEMVDERVRGGGKVIKIEGQEKEGRGSIIEID